jgi:predicted CoA-binding protein
MRACPKPVIAAVEGAAAGGGFSVCLGCDLIVAAEDAKFVMSYAKAGLSPDGGGSDALAHALAPAGRARDPARCRAGHGCAVARARAWSIAWSPQAARVAEAIAWAARLAEGPAGAQARIKQLVYAARGRSPPRAARRRARCVHRKPLQRRMRARHRRVPRKTSRTLRERSPVTDLLQSALDPKSIAIIGASENPNKIGGRPIMYMNRHGYSGKIYPINPNRAEIQGVKAYPSLAALPEVPELAIVIVGGDATVAAVNECADRGVKTAIIIASGFAETGPEGRAVQDEMVRHARAKGMRLVGPNTQDWPTSATARSRASRRSSSRWQPGDGPVAVVSQSGGMAAVTYGLLRGRGIGVRHVHATGNEADVTVAALTWAITHDQDVKLVMLYMENIAQPELLAEAASWRGERDLPIIAVKAGRTEGGQKAASSHTGSLANEDRVVDAFLQPSRHLARARSARHGARRRRCT